jgi:hypothetical protein
MHRKTAILGLALAACGVAGEAAGETFDVKGLHVVKGGMEIALDNAAFSSGAENRSSHEQLVHYGVLDWWRLSAAVEWDNPVGDNLRATHLAVESLFVLRPMRQKHDMGLGLFAALETSIHGDATNALVLGPIVTARWDNLTWAFNPFLEQTFGRNREDGIAFTYGWQAKYELREGLAVGVEGYGLVEDLGDSPRLAEQQHRVGPVLFTEVEVAKNFKIEPSFGVLFGLTSATPDVTLRFNVDIHLH